MNSFLCHHHLYILKCNIYKYHHHHHLIFKAHQNEQVNILGVIQSIKDVRKISAKIDTPSSLVRIRLDSLSADVLYG